jgi:hypothetical protein
VDIAGDVLDFGVVLPRARDGRSHAALEGRHCRE